MAVSSDDILKRVPPQNLEAEQSVLGAILLSFVPEILRYSVEPVQRALFGRSFIDPEVIRMLLFGLAMVVMMLFRPAGLLPSALRKRELAVAKDE